MAGRVVMTDVLTEEFQRRWREDLQGAADDIVMVEDGSEAALTRAVEGAHVLITRNRPVDARVLEAAGRNVRMVVKLGRWPLGIDRDACAARSVAVRTVPLLDAITVAEHAMALMLACARDVVRAHIGVAAGAYREQGLTPKRTAERSFAFKWLPVQPTEVYGATLGIVGFGEIGREVSQRARAFGMNVVYYDANRMPPEWERELGVGYRELHQLLGEADYVTLHIPHTPQTEKLIGRRELDAMKPSACLVNTCRGGVVDEEALADALQTGGIGRAGLDVFVDEPLRHDHPLTGLENVVLTCHIGGGSGGGRKATAQAVREALAEAGGAPGEGNA